MKNTDLQSIQPLGIIVLMSCYDYIGTHVEQATLHFGYNETVRLISDYHFIKRSGSENLVILTICYSVSYFLQWYGRFKFCCSQVDWIWWTSHKKIPLVQQIQKQI